MPSPKTPTRPPADIILWDDPLPDELTSVYADTQFTVALLEGAAGLGSPVADAATALMHQLSARGIEVWTTPAGVQECWWVIGRACLRRLGAGHHSQATADQWRQAWEEIAAQWRYLATFGLVVRSPRDLGSSAASSLLMQCAAALGATTLMQPADALHAASDLLDGPCAIISDDAHFQKLPQPFLIPAHRRR